MARFTRAQHLAQVQRTPLIPVFYHAAETYARHVLTACYEGGVRLFEFTNRGPNAFDIFADLQQFVEAEYPDLLLGAGTIFTVDEAEKFIAAGADFIVQPVASPEVAAVCHHYDLAWLPGAQTLNEVYEAARQGATVVKLFPASHLGPAYLSTLRGPLPHVPIMATGGIQPTVAEVTDWIKAGATCVGVDSRLLKTESPAELTEQVAGLLRAMQPDA